MTLSPQTYSVKEFLEFAFSYVNLNWQDYVAFDKRYLRPAEVELLIGDPTKTNQKLGWQPTVTFEQLVHLMVEADLQALGISPSNNGTALTSADLATIRQPILQNR